MRVAAARFTSAATRPRLVRAAAEHQTAFLSGTIHDGASQRLMMGRFASTTGNAGSSTMDELLKRDFRRWLGKEARVLAAMIVLGVTGVHFYQNREGAPAKQVATLLDKAREDAKKEDREAALKKCLKAYCITKSTNTQDRHLFEMAFLVAAQFETLQNTSQAARYYHEALGSVPYIRDAAERDMSRVVVLDRLAQCYQDQGQQRAAENYYRQAIEAYDKSRSGRSSSSSVIKEQTDRDIAAVLYNYGQHLMHLKRWDEATQVLQRAQSAARAADVSSDDKLRIDRLMAMLQQAGGDETETPDDDVDTD